jgi:peptidoglycan hydrolase CwlO-like protein
MVEFRDENESGKFG